jgi:5,10-methenyltetrahydrofolate synthetase
MFNFPSFRGFQTHCWLNVEQSGGQERPDKAALRRSLRQERENYKKNSVLKNLPWGQEHVARLGEFFGTWLPASSPGAREWPSSWFGYFPIGSELNLLGHRPMEGCYLPQAQTDGSLLWYSWSSSVELWPKDSRSLPIPPEETLLRDFNPNPNSPWMVITPCLAVDLSGTRLGYGGGFYDRFLCLNKESVLSVACVPSQLLLGEHDLPKEQHDESVDIIVTENRVVVLAEKKAEKIFRQLLKMDRG